MIVLTAHARRQIRERLEGIVTEGQVLAAVNKYEADIDRLTDRVDVKILVGTISYTVLADGSNGDVIIAAVDPRRKNVNTVFLRRREQLDKWEKIDTCKV